MKTNRFLIVLFSVFMVGLTCGLAHSREFKIIILQDDRGVAERYRPLLAYLKKNGVDTGFVSAPNYSAAARMFAGGAGDAMFSGSGIAGTMMVKELAYPLVRPVSQEGVSTYHAVVVVRKGAPKFTDTAEYFNGKRVIFTALASAGEFFFRSYPNIGTVRAVKEIAASHGAALDALSRGAADVAIVKNLVWEKRKGNYPGLEKVKDDTGENPDMTLMVAKKADSQTAANLSRILLALKIDTSPDARAVKSKLGIQGYISTSRQDFKHTLSLLKKAGVTKSFDFRFE